MGFRRTRRGAGGETYAGDKLWCDASGYTHPLARPTFGKVVGAALPGAVTRNKKLPPEV